METAYLICAAAGGTLLLIQTIMVVFGTAADATDADHVESAAEHATGESFVKLLSWKALVAFVTFFGLAGLASREAGIAEETALGIGLAAGVTALFVVGWLMALLARLHSQGNVKLENAIGREAVVYLRIPRGATAAGKVTLEVQERTLECAAVTPGDDIPTGTRVRVTALRDAQTLVVSPLTLE